MAVKKLSDLLSAVGKGIQNPAVVNDYLKDPAKFGQPLSELQAVGKQFEAAGASLESGDIERTLTQVSQAVEGAKEVVKPALDGLPEIPTHENPFSATPTDLRKLASEIEGTVKSAVEKTGIELPNPPGEESDYDAGPKSP